MKRESVIYRLISCFEIHLSSRVKDTEGTHNEFILTVC